MASGYRFVAFFVQHTGHAFSVRLMGTSGPCTQRGDGAERTCADDLLLR